MKSADTDHAIAIAAPEQKTQPVFSLPALLALVGGICILFALELNKRRIRLWPPVLRKIIAAVAILLIVFAIVKTIVYFVRRRRGTVHTRRRTNFTMLTREGGAYLVIMSVMAAGSLIGRSNLLMLVFAMMAGPFVMNGWIVSAMLARLRVTRKIPRRAMAGQPISVEISVDNQKKRLSSRLIVVKDEVSNGTHVVRPSTLFVCLPPGNARSGSYTLHLMQRGRYRLGSLSVSSHFPLGLVDRGRFFPAEDKILIHPHLGRLKHGLRQTMTQASELAERSRGHSGIFDDEFHRIREFRQGDNPRAIHWRSTARKNELMVREFEQSRDQNLVVLLDLNNAHLEPHLIELAISFVATLFVEHTRSAREANVALFLSGQELRSAQGPVCPQVLESILDLLAEAQATKDDRIDELLSQSRVARGNAGTRVLFLTGGESDATCRVEALEHESTADGMAGGAIRNVRVLPISEAEIFRHFELPEMVHQNQETAKATPEFDLVSTESDAISESAQPAEVTA